MTYGGSHSDLGQITSPGGAPLTFRLPLLPGVEERTESEEAQGRPIELYS